MAGLRVYYVFEFRGGQFNGVCGGEYRSRAAALRHPHNGTDFVETEIIVHPRKGRSTSYPVTHKLAHLPAQKPPVRFLAVVEEDEYFLMRERAEAVWTATKAQMRERIAREMRRPGPANPDDLPTRLKRRIRLDPKGCWLWLTLLRRRRTRWGWRAYASKSPSGEFMMDCRVFGA